MVRKLILSLLVGMIMCLGATPLLAVGEYPGGEVGIFATPQAYKEATGETIAKFSEAPELREKVAAGELPPLEQRLPDEPLVLSPAVSIGEYGGTLNSSAVSDILWEFPLTYGSDWESIEPNIFKSWEVQDDGRVWTFHIRKGLKWSDGAPFNADDFMFWYNDVALNEELWPRPPATLVLDEEVGKWEKIDDYTIKMSWSQPYGLLLNNLCRWRRPPYEPKHYLKQYHPAYTSADKIQEAVEKEGYGNWVELFQKKASWDTLGTPTLCMFIKAAEPKVGVALWERNPYYWKIDTEGNQLPYINELHQMMEESPETRLLGAIAGNIDIVMGELLGYQANMALLKKEEQRGGYEIVTANWSITNGFGSLLFNLSHEDPVLRKIFNEKRFRVALSVAMDREEINDILFNGTYRISQWAPPTGPPFYGELPQFQAYTQYDPDFANYLLDSVGLDKWNLEGTVRLRPDGKPLQVILAPSTWQSIMPNAAEMVAKYWEDVGVAVTVKPETIGLSWQRHAAGTYEIRMVATETFGASPLVWWANWFPQNKYLYLNSGWGLWFETEGKEGDEPPAAVMRLAELARRQAVMLSSEERIQVEKEAQMIQTENLWVISMLVEPNDAYYHLITNRLKNVRKPCPNEMNPSQPSTWYIEE